MKVVIDSNRVIAALLKDSTTRELVFSKNFEFVAPSFIRSEIEKYRLDILRKASLTDDMFGALLSLLFERITILAIEDYTSFLKECEKELGDLNDVPYLAAAKASSAAGIWTHDPHFLDQHRVMVFTNIDMLRLIRKRT